MIQVGQQFVTHAGNVIEVEKRDANCLLYFNRIGIKEVDGTFRPMPVERWSVLHDGWLYGALDSGVVKPWQYENLFEKIGRETGQTKHDSKMLY